MALLDTIVIGAGWAGVVATHDLAVKGHSVLLLEARNRIGGRARTYRDGMHVPIDLGCSWIHGYEQGNPAREIAGKVGVKALLPTSTERVVYGPDGPLPHSVASKLRADLASARAAAYAFAQSSESPPHLSTPLSDFLFSPASPLFSSSDHSLSRSLARSLEIPFGTQLEKISLRYTGWENAFTGSDAAPEAGFQPLVEAVLSEAQNLGADIHIGEPVHALERRDDGHVTVRTNNGSYDARFIICTVPLGVLKDAPYFTPPLPRRRLEIIAGTHVGVLEKLVLAYPVAWWPGASSIGSYTFLPTRTMPSKELADPKAILASHTLVMASFAAPGLPNPHPTLVFHLSCTPAQLLLAFSVDDVASAAHAFLIERLNPSATPPEPTASVLTNWTNDPFSKGAAATPSVIGENRSPLDFIELGKPLWDGRLGFAGEHTDADNRGSVAGAIMSGQREAVRVTRRLVRPVKQ
ncbi:flavin-containing amine oxidoreductase [Ramaria rubella]|nr:flavin-containing amine oxidoreductase [Ramaria rubella]